MSRTEIDESYDRLIQIRSLILERKQNALGSPEREELILGRFVDRGDNRAKARENINQRFDELFRRAERYGKLDMCAVFERLVLSYIPLSLAESKKHIKNGGLRYFVDVSDAFVRDQSSFGSIDSIIKLFDGYDNNLFSVLSRIRVFRNEISHGKKHLTSEGLSGEVIRDTLNSALKAFRIV